MIRKKFYAVLLTITLGMTAGTPMVFAKSQANNMPKGIVKKESLPPGLSKKIFKDIEKYPWAIQAIERMQAKGLVKGYADKTFAPQKTVTKLETVIMALRIMGWEQEAKGITKLPEKYKGKAVGSWAYGYVALAYQKGILDDVDLMYFNPQEEAKRHEVAKYVIRALGDEKEAKKHMREELPFVDASAIPQGSVGYVYLMNQLNLMKGDQLKRFNPMGSLTRAEMAVLFSRLDEKVTSNVEAKEIKGELIDIDNGRVELKVDGREKKFEVSNDIVVYQGNKKITYADLKEGQKILLELKEGKVVYIEILEDGKKTEKLIGKLTQIDAVGIFHIEIGGKEYEVDKEVKLKIEGIQNPKMEDLKIGDAAEVEIIKDIVVEIEVER